MKPTDEERITRWIDGELSDSDVADLLSADPELTTAKREAGELGELLRQELKPERSADVPHADFFSHRLRERIVEEANTGSSDASAGLSLREEARILPLFTRMRFAAGMAFVLMLAAMIGHAVWTTSSSAAGSEVVSTYTPDPDVVATTRYSSEAEATVIVLEGVAEVPTGQSIAGVFPDSYQPCGDFGRTVLTDHSNGHPLLALAIDANGRPEFTALRF